MSFLGDPMIVILAILGFVLPPLNALATWRWNKINGITEVE